MDDAEASWFDDEDPSALLEHEENMDDIPFPTVSRHENSPTSFSDSLDGPSSPPLPGSNESNSNSLSPRPWKPLRIGTDNDEDDIADVFKASAGKKVRTVKHIVIDIRIRSFQAKSIILLWMKSETSF